MDAEYIKDYQDFVLRVTSKDSYEIVHFLDRLKMLNSNKVQHTFNLPLLLTAGVGLSSEAGEFSDEIKKIFFHGKNPDDEVKDKLKKELGDVMWYWMNACTALNLDPKEVIDANIEKLSKRYPGGFDAFRSANKESFE